MPRMYDRKAYLRKKALRLKKTAKGTEEAEAYEAIRKKWWWDDLTICRRLKENTVSEIIGWEMGRDGKFSPKEIYRIFAIVAMIATVFAVAYFSSSQCRSPQSTAFVEEWK